MSYQEMMFQAVIKNDKAQILRLLNKEPSLVNVTTAQGLPLVLFAMYYNQADVAQLLVSQGAILDIFSASAIGKLERVRELAEANPTLVNAYAIDGYQPLGLASFFGQLGIVKYLISKGANVNSPSANQQRTTPLHSAVEGQHLETAHQLLRHGAQVNARQAGDFTPLHSAAFHGSLAMVMLLLEYGADLTAQSSDGRTPLDMALESGNQDLVDFFLTVN